MSVLSATHSLVAPKSRMTEERFVAWSMEPNENRAEWADGKVIYMPAVELSHARMVHFLTRLLGDFAEEHELGEVLGERYQVRFAKLRRRRIPEVIFISAARTRFLEPMQFEGAPDLIVEVVSAESQTRDRREKYLEYRPWAFGNIGSSIHW